MAHDRRQLRSFHLFAGAGGGALADLLLGHRPVGACEIEEYPRNVLLQRQRDGILPMFPLWDDIKTLDGKPWRGHVDIVAGGFPCQDISTAGKGAGITGERSGLWSEMARIISEIQPAFAVVENSPMLTSRGLGVVLGDLATLGYDARWGVLGAHHLAGPHARERIWIVANATLPNGQGAELGQSRKRKSQMEPRGLHSDTRGAHPWKREMEPKPRMVRVADGMANRLDKRHRAVGNGQIPQVAALAWNILNKNGAPT